MTARPGYRGGGGIGIVFPIVGYVLIAPPALFMLPLAALSIVAGARRREAWVMAVIAGAFAIWWFAALGPPPEQLQRAAAVIASGAFVIFTLRTAWTVVHRGLMSVLLAAGGVWALGALSPRGWAEIQWWVQYRATGAQNPMISALLLTRAPGVSGDETFDQIAALIARMPDLAAAFFPSVLAIQLFAGLALAAWIAHRVGMRFRAPVGRFVEFRFAEPLGWITVAALATIWVVDGGPLWMAAANLLLVMGGLYTVRGIAVAAFGLLARGFRSWLLGALLIVAAILFWRIALAGFILLGVLDTGLNLRRRWQAS